jgi:membrane protein implicated in regulation of membrane protease activity
MLLLGAIALALFVLPPGWGLAAVVLGIAIEIAEVGFWIRFLRRYRVQTGSEGLIGLTGEVIEACDPRGRIRLRGEIWHAHCSSRAGVGERVEVTGVEGLTLEVESTGTEV